MKTLAILLLTATLATADYYNEATGKQAARLPTSYPVEGGVLTNPSAADHAAMGWLLTPVVRFDVPAGYVAIGAPWIEVVDGVPYQRQNVETIAAHEAKRIAALVPTYGETVGTLVALLAKFGIELPTTQTEATPIIYAGAKANPDLNPDALLVLAIYQGLRADLTDADIYAISEVIK